MIAFVSNRNWKLHTGKQGSREAQDFSKDEQDRSAIVDHVFAASGIDCSEDHRRIGEKWYVQVIEGSIHHKDLL